jgi:pimeloyl-ACP methyl ester carboxylesterase
MTAPYDPQVTIQGKGEAVVLVPGMNGSACLFYRQTPLLARSYRVATYALRDTATTMDQLVEDLAGVIQMVAPVERRAIVVGESFGGALALSLALAQPERVNALVIVNSFSHFASRLRLHLAVQGLSAIPWAVMPILRRLTAFRLHSRQTPREEIGRFLELTAGATKQGYLSRLRLLTRYDVREKLSEIQHPSLFLAADQDRLVPSVAYARHMADCVPGAVMRVLAGHGHTCLIAPDIDLEQMLNDWRSSVFL